MEQTFTDEEIGFLYKEKQTQKFSRGKAILGAVYAIILLAAMLCISMGVWAFIFTIIEKP